MRTICERRLIGGGALALLIASGVLITSCSDDGHEAPEQQPIEQQDAQRAAPRDTQRAQDEGTQCPEPAQALESEQATSAHRRPSDDDSEDIDESDVEEADSQMWFAPGTAARTLQGRLRSRGTGLSAGAGTPEGTSDAVSKQPLVPPVAQPRYEFGIYMGTPDQTRGVRPLRVDSGDPPSYSTMKPISPNVSESTVLPEMQSGW